jgi:hypothetical protein
MPTKKTPTKVVTKKVAPAKTATKKVATEKPVKKAPAKKIVAKVGSKKPLVYANEQQSFWVKNGQILNSLISLRDALDEMEKEVYSYHAGAAHNDFAKWVSDVLADSACAVELGKAKSPKTAKSVVVKHLKFYSV